MADMKLIGPSALPTRPAAVRFPFYSRYVADATGTMTHFAVCGYTVNGFAKAAIFADDRGNNQPGTLLAQVGSNYVTAGQWTFISCEPINIIAQTKYWLAYMPAASNVLGYRENFDIIGMRGPQVENYDTYSFGSNPSIALTYDPPRAQAIQAWSIATGGAGRLIGGPGKHPLISGPGKHPLISCGGNALIG